MKLGERIKANYHWVIAAVSVLALIICGGVGNSLSSIALIPITETLGVSRGEYSTAMMAKSVGGVIISLASGALLVKFGYRKLIVACLLISSVGYFTTSGSQTLLVMSLSGVLEGAYGLCTGAGNPRLLSSWFHRHYGLITGIVTAMTGLGGSIFSIIFGKIVARAGWRSAYVVVAVMMLGVALMIALLVRNKPEDMGLRPYGEGYAPKNTKKDSKDHWEGYSFAELKKKPVFYMLVFGTFLTAFCAYMAFTVLVSHLRDCGMSTEIAAGINSVVMFALAAFKLGFGFLSDKVGAKRMTMVSLVALVVSLLLLSVIKSVSLAYLAAVVYSLALTLCGIVPMLLTPCLFGYHSSTKAMGVILAMLSAANMLAAPLSNTLRDRLGSYSPVFRGAAVAAMGAIVLYSAIYVMAGKERKRFESEMTKNACQ